MENNLEQNPQISLSIFFYKSCVIWFAGAGFALFQFFLQLSSGVILTTIMLELNLNGLQAGILGSAFYYVYTSMQIPVGILFDRYNPRKLIASSALLCSLGCVFFAYSEHYNTLLISRLIIGAGSSFAFVGLSHLLRQYFPLKYFSLLLGLSETLAFLIIALGVAHLSGVIHFWGWRVFMLYAGCIGLFISLITWAVIPNSTSIIALASDRLIKPSGLENRFGICSESVRSNETITEVNRSGLFKLFTNPYLWLNGLFVFLSFIPITVFGAMWAVPFIQIKLQCSLNQAAFIDSWLFVGAALSCPFAGFLTAYTKTHHPVTIASSLITALFIFIIIHTHAQQIFIYALLMFLIGFFCGGYMLAFSICNYLSNIQQRTTATGFTNTMAMLSAPIFIPLIGYLTDSLKANGQTPFTAFQYALNLLPLMLIIAAVFACFLPGQHERSDILKEETP